jgi:hypothetical protein
MQQKTKKPRLQDEIRHSSPTNPVKVLNPIVRKVEESAQIREDLNENGFSVIRDILTAEEQSNFYDYFWDVRGFLISPALDFYVV